MRTFSLLSTAIAISTLAAALGVSCALPPYLHDTGGGSSASGGASPGTSSVAATTSTASSSGAGQGGAGGDSTADAASSSTSSGSVAASSGSGMDAGACNADDWKSCPGVASTTCSCMNQICYVGMCGGNAEQVDVLTCDGKAWGNGGPQPPPASCCPGLAEPCRPGTLCVVETVNNQKTSKCVNDPCIAQHPGMPCACAQNFCSKQVPLQCSELNPGAVMCGP